MMRPTPSAWALWPTLGATWIAFAQVLSFQGLALWVIVGSLLTAGVVLPLAKAQRRLLAPAAMVGSTMAVAGLANSIGGNTAGPITRSALMACAVTGAMALALPTRYRAAILPMSLMLLAGALGLGAAEQVLWLTGMWVVAAAVTLAILGPFRNQDLRAAARLRPFAIMLAALGAAGVALIVVLAPFLGSPWTIPGAGVIAAPEDSASSTLAESPPVPIEDPDFSSPPSSPPPPPSPPPQSLQEVPVESSSVLASVVNWLQILLLVLALLLVILLLYALLRRTVAWLQWRILRRRLRKGTARDKAIGAWTFARLHRARIEAPLPNHVSPDVAVDWASRNGDPDVLDIATVVTGVAFNDATALDPSLANKAWAAAHRIGKAKPHGMRHRWRVSRVTPARARRLLRVTPSPHP